MLHARIYALVLGIAGVGACSAPSLTSRGDDAPNGKPAQLADDTGSTGDRSLDAGRDADGADEQVVCSDAPPKAGGCVPPPGTPLYTEPPTQESSDVFFHQPKFGGLGFFGTESTRFDGYSVVVDWPAQPVVAKNNPVAVWPGMNHDGGYFSQLVYWPGDTACYGSIALWIFKYEGNGSKVVYQGGTPLGAFCSGPQDRLQLRGERHGNLWVYSYQLVGSGVWTEVGRYDFGAATRGKNPLMGLIEEYDYDDSVEKLSPVSFTSFLVKESGKWKPVERLVTTNDFDATARILVNPDPAHAGVVTSVAGPVCYVGRQQLLWDTNTPCWASAVQCDETTGTCSR